MKVLIMEILYPQGHIAVNKAIVEIISNISEVVYLADYNDYFGTVKLSENINKVNVRMQFLPKRIKHLIILCFVLNTLIIKSQMKDHEFDSIVLLSSSNEALPFIRKIFKNKRIYIFHHNDIDLMIKNKKTKIFKTYMNSVYHFVFADFIKDGLIRETGVDKSRVYTVNHPITENTVSTKPNTSAISEKVFIGLGLSNDEKLIDELIKFDKSGEKLSKNRKIIIRSKQTNYSGNWLNVFSGYLDNDEYLNMYKKASAILLCYPNIFRYRYSGSFINAMIEKKKVFSSHTLLGKYFNTKYPNNCKTFTSAAELISIIDSFDEEFDDNEYDDFIRDHREEKIKEDMLEYFRRDDDAAISKE